MCITMTPEDNFGGNNEVFRKCLSCVSNTLFSFMDKEKSLESFSPLGPYSASKPFSIKNFTNLDLTFSSAKNFILSTSLEHDNSSMRGSLCSEAQCGIDVCFGERRVVLQDFSNCFSALQHLQNLPNHDSGSFESGGSTTNLSVCNDIIIDFDYHNLYSREEVYKDFDFTPIRYNSDEEIDNYSSELISLNSSLSMFSNFLTNSLSSMKNNICSNYINVIL